MIIYNVQCTHYNTAHMINKYYYDIKIIKNCNIFDRNKYIFDVF